MAMSQQDTLAFAEATCDSQVALSPFRHSDSDFAFDPLFINRRLPGHPDLPVLGMVVLAGPTPDTIHVMIPDCLIPPVGSDVHIDLRHVVMLQLGPATDIGDYFPPPDLALALCRKPLAPTRKLQQKTFWEEINPLLAKWKRNVNVSRCPECDRSIRVNMARHLRLCHTSHVCFWRCPVNTCPLWFTSELNGKDHIKRIHQFREGRGVSFYEYLRTYGLEWYGNRAFFDQRKESTQSIWVDLSLARRFCT